MTPRFRFAPSPTGALHIGGARTAFYNWLLARGGGGSLVLRIEDTDRERSTDENIKQILDALDWLGIDFDEGPVFQTDRAERHADALRQLIASGDAYHSTATAETVREWRNENPNSGFRGEPEDSGAVRLRLPDSGDIYVDDVIRGEVKFDLSQMDDPVIARADGSVLYNFAVAIDDIDAAITHVVRGEDHLSNTPKQLVVYEALGAEKPVYAHLPLLHGPDGKKLSKRHGAASVQELRNAGYLPETVRNYIALLGWGYDDETTFFSTAELVEKFSLDRVSRSPAVFDEKKLRWMNGRYIRNMPLGELVDCLEEYVGRGGLNAAVAAAHEKLQTLNDFWPLVRWAFEEPERDERAWQKVFGRQGAAERLKAARKVLTEQVDRFDAEELEQALSGLVAELGCKPNELFQPIRVAITGTTVSPGIFESLSLLGGQRTLERIDLALENLADAGESEATPASEKQGAGRFLR